MATKIYYVYNKVTGEFAGSGTVAFQDDVYGCTEVCPSKDVACSEPVLLWDGQEWKKKVVAEDAGE